MTKLLIKRIVCFSLILTFCSCITPYYYKHNQNEAASIATLFAELAFIKRDNQSAFSYLNDGGMDINDLSMIIEKMHQDASFPKQIYPIEYEIVPNQNVIIIFLKGVNKNNEFYYKAFMIKNNDSYKVLGIYRNTSNTPYPKTPLRKSL